VFNQSGGVARKVEGFRAELKRARIELGISIKKASEDLGIGRSHIRDMENGKYIISPANGKKLCDYYGIDGELFVRDCYRRERIRILEKLESEFGTIPLEFKILKRALEEAKDEDVYSGIC
jgi:transcriptional regulator with XRE-family HTH domain